MSKKKSGTAAKKAPKKSTTYAPWEVQRGRPTKYRPEYCERLVELMAAGNSVNAAAMEMGFDNASMYDWAGKYPEFSIAMSRGKQALATWYEKEAKNNLANGRYNANLFKFLSANVIGWSDKVEHNTKVEISTDPETKSILRDLRAERAAIEVVDVTPPVLELCAGAEEEEEGSDAG